MNEWDHGKSSVSSDLNYIIHYWFGWKAAWSLCVRVHVCLSVFVLSSCGRRGDGSLNVHWVAGLWCSSCSSMSWRVCSGLPSCLFVGLLDKCRCCCGDGVSLHVVSGFPTLRPWLLQTDLCVFVFAGNLSDDNEPCHCHSSFSFF